MADVLVAQEDTLRRFVVTRQLSARGHRVRGVANGAEVLEALENQDFDVLVLDVHMPILGGVATAEIIRSSRKRYSGVPIIALTGRVLREEVERFLAAGMDHCVSRPYTVDRLQESIAQALRPKAA